MLRTADMTNPLRLGDAIVHALDRTPAGGVVERDGELFYRISDYDAMPPFFLTVVSGADHWMFVSSTGGLTCGRRDPGNALFPYTTDDRIHDACTHTGPVTAIIATRDERSSLWQPFAPGPRLYRLQRNLYKNRLGNRLVFEEVNETLGLVFSYEWTTGECLGFLRRACLENTHRAGVRVELLDGLRNLLPYGVDRNLQAERSTLVDAYKQAERVAGLDAALFTLSSIPSDRAEPSEALKANVAWSIGLEAPTVLLSERQLGRFLAGGEIEDEATARGQRCAFLLRSTFDLAPASERRWWIAADVEQGPVEVEGLLRALGQEMGDKEILSDARTGSRRLRSLLGQADGFQCSADVLTASRHLSNTLFNVMRGGVFGVDYHIEVADFLQFVERWNAPLRARFEELLEAREKLPLEQLVGLARESGNPDLERLAREYLPLMFSRRHGDPSRPWNQFSIAVRNPDGSPCLYFEGNWRDIFQNWEALAFSYPEYVESFITKFVNASTADGYNPYRIERGGFDWEVLDEEDPWSNIGYWGDHQVAYLQRLLQFSQRAHPGRLAGQLNLRAFVYADVPYRLKPYAEQLRDPRNTVEYDASLAELVSRRVGWIGADGKLVVGPDAAILHVTLLEKLLVPALTKLAHLVPGGGVWMNTQRPEWNDANNALVGYGLSMVTLCQLRAYLDTVRALLDETREASFGLSREVLDAFAGIDELLRAHRDMLGGAVTDRQRKEYLDGAGAVAERWRASVYDGFSGATGELDRAALTAFLQLALRYLDHSIEANRRPDGLYHSYNLAAFGADRIGVEHLPEMLEGQVAVLACGVLDAQQSLDLLDALRASRLYRADQDSYLLYPDRPQVAFRTRNRVPQSLVEKEPWILAEARSARGYLHEDALGQVRFDGSFRNAAVLRSRVERDGNGPADDLDRLCALYEQVFNHRRFTGRSGSMFKYEGLGCIYWHMVSKLALALAELAERADRTAAAGGEQVLAELGRRYRAVRDGLGVHKSPADYGAFPTDPYSHTPGFAGVQQPGMTGQVKEDVIARLLELGVRIEAGCVRFRPFMLARDEFLRERTLWRHWCGGEEHEEWLAPDSLGFSLCGVPVVYRIEDEASITIFGRGEARETISGSELPADRSRSLFGRDGEIRRIVVGVPPAVLSGAGGSP